MNRISRRGWRVVIRLGVPVAAAGLALVAMPSPAQAILVPPPAAATIASTNPSDLTPHAQNGEARAFAEIGGTVYVGGSFTNIRTGTGAWTARPYLFAYNRSTGAISTTFLPQLDGAVNALAVSPTGKLIVGGAFRNVNGAARRNLVALEPSNGATVASWVGVSDGGVVRTMARHNNQLYIGGAFHWINGSSHSLLARLDATTGAVDNTFQINASVPRGSSEYVWTLALSPDGTTLVAGGNFTQVNGLPRNQIVMATTTGTPAVADWSTQRYVPPCYSWAFVSYVQDIDFADDSSYFVVAANGGTGGGSYCDAIARFETSTRGANVDGTWVDFTGTDSVTAIEAADGVIYTGGHFRWMNNANASDAAGPGAVDRLGIAALDANNGMPLNWNPRRSGGSNLPAGASAWGQNVAALWRGPDGIYFGHNSDGMGNEYHGRLGMFPMAGGRTIAVQNAPAGTNGYLYLGGTSGQLTKVSFDGTTLGAPAVTSQPNLTSAGAAFSLGSRLFWSKTDAAAPSGSTLQFSSFNGTVGGGSTSGFNSWYRAADMSGAFFLSGRMYYTKAGTNTLFYRYLEFDGSYVGCTEFSIPTQNLAWGTVRGMAWHNGSIVYGSTDGSLRKVAFDAAAPGGFAVDGATAVVLAAPSAGATWSSPTLFYATV